MKRHEIEPWVRENTAYINSRIRSLIHSVVEKVLKFFT